jgi:hypothetical protein
MRRRRSQLVPSMRLVWGAMCLLLARLGCLASPASSPAFVSARASAAKRPSRFAGVALLRSQEGRHSSRPRLTCSRSFQTSGLAFGRIEARTPLQVAQKANSQR